MELNTASAAVRFAKQLEDESRQVYERVAERYPQWESTLAPFIRENKRNVGSIDRAYIGVVSDALDTQFAFEGVDTDDYRVITDLPDSPDEAIAGLWLPTRRRSSPSTMPPRPRRATFWPTCPPRLRPHRLQEVASLRGAQSAY